MKKQLQQLFILVVCQENDISLPMPIYIGLVWYAWPKNEFPKSNFQKWRLLVLRYCNNKTPVKPIYIPQFLNPDFLILHLAALPKLCTVIPVRPAHDPSSNTNLYIILIISVLLCHIWAYPFDTTTTLYTTSILTSD